MCKRKFGDQFIHEIRECIDLAVKQINEEKNLKAFRSEDLEITNVDSFQPSCLSNANTKASEKTSFKPKVRFEINFYNLNESLIQDEEIFEEKQLVLNNICEFGNKINNEFHIQCHVMVIFFFLRGSRPRIDKSKKLVSRVFRKCCFFFKWWRVSK